MHNLLLHPLQHPRLLILLFLLRLFPWCRPPAGSIAWICVLVCECGFWTDECRGGVFLCLDQTMLVICTAEIGLRIMEYGGETYETSLRPPILKIRHEIRHLEEPISVWIECLWWCGVGKY